MRNSFLVEVEIDNKKITSIFEEFEKAKSTMLSCMHELENIGLFKIKSDLQSNGKSDVNHQSDNSLKI